MKQITGYKTIFTINNNQFAINYSHKLFQNKEIIKKGVPQNGKNI